ALGGSAGVMLGLITAIRTLLTRDPRSQSQLPHGYSEDAVVLVLIIILIISTLVLGIYPQALSTVALQMANGFTFFSD
ncbi:MAG: hypothetical protein P1S60_11380, partial [Anaerolineae bacterium]|nr:hypothetical protein [Anaerolineae bacterium]